jgi:hypothetical protein
MSQVPGTVFVFAFTLPLVACVTTTGAPTLETDAARAWLRETGQARVRVDSPGDVTRTGRILATSATAMRLQGADGGDIDVPVRAGTTISERRRGSATLVGAVAGLCFGIGAGAIVSEAVSSPNPDSAGGREHFVAAIPIGAIAGVIVGAIAGGVVGSERRLEIGR